MFTTFFYLAHVLYTNQSYDHVWLVVYLPLWKIWVRQLGWWHSQYMEIHKIHVPVTTNQMCFSGITNLMGGPRFKNSCSMAYSCIWHLPAKISQKMWRSHCESRSFNPNGKALGNFHVYDSMLIYPLVMTNIAMKMAHRNRWFSQRTSI